jgi:hypothetical protein
LFHFYIRRRKKGCPSVGVLKLVCGSVISDNLGMSQLFVESYSSVFVAVVPVSPALLQVYPGVMDDLVITHDMVYDVLCRLSSSSAPGPDGVHPHLLKSCARALLHPLSDVFSLSLSSGTLPNMW